ncbi:hypothetical protein PMI05_01598 [Brevibacillus sp. BC25]|nr:hypothetical protein PMI05_01598 [Brevibacillus sp. BC25]
MHPFVAGDKVEHPELGQGVVIQWQPAKLLVKWEIGRILLIMLGNVRKGRQLFYTDLVSFVFRLHSQ